MDRDKLTAGITVGSIGSVAVIIALLLLRKSSFGPYASAFDVLLLIAGLGSIFYVTYILAKQVFPDEEKLAAQRRLGVEDSIRDHKQPILRWLSPIYRLILPRVQQMDNYLVNAAYRTKLKKYFVSAGLDEELTPDEFVAFKILMSVVSLVFGVMSLENMGYPITWLPCLLFLVGGFLLPDAWSSSLRKERLRKVQRQLPHVIDLLTLSVEAGQDFLAALTRVVTKSKPGPLVDEMQKMLREIQLGTRRSDALRNMANRINLAELSSFATILIQADQLGASIGPVLRAQSDQLRTNRFQLAEQMGAKAATKILIPMIIFIMPAVFIAILGPIGLNVYYNMKLGELFGAGGG